MKTGSSVVSLDFRYDGPEADEVWADAGRMPSWARRVAELARPARRRKERRVDCGERSTLNAERLTLNGAGVESEVWGEEEVVELMT
jgi:hypothetical protein